MQVFTLCVRLCGIEIIPKTVSTRNRGCRFVMSEPISVYVQETAPVLILVDAAINCTLINDPHLCQQYFRGRGWSPAPVVYPEYRLLTQLEGLGCARRILSTPSSPTLSPTTPAT